MSPLAWPSKVAYAVPRSKWPASMVETHVLGGSPVMFFATLVQLLPPFCVTCTLPSSVPAQMICAFFGDSEMVKMVSYFSASELSTVKPPDSDCFSHSGLLVVRSGEIFSHES